MSEVYKRGRVKFSDRLVGIAYFCCELLVVVLALLVQTEKLSPIPLIWIKENFCGESELGVRFPVAPTTNMCNSCQVITRDSHRDSENTSCTG